VGWSRAASGLRFFAGVTIASFLLSIVAGALGTYADSHWRAASLSSVARLFEIKGAYSALVSVALAILRPVALSRFAALPPASSARTMARGAFALEVIRSALGIAVLFAWYFAVRIGATRSHSVALSVGSGLIVGFAIAAQSVVLYNALARVARDEHTTLPGWAIVPFVMIALEGVFGVFTDALGAFVSMSIPWTWFLLGTAYHATIAVLVTRLCRMSARLVASHDVTHARR
jgi:hypothetical protein